MDENIEEEFDIEVAEGDEELAKQRFVASRENTEIFFEPQCVNCLHNKGLVNCAVHGQKPEHYMTNVDRCPDLSE